MTANTTTFNECPSAMSLAGRPFNPESSRVTVIGGGVMGPGLAQVFAEQGFDVDLCDTNALAMERCIASLKDSVYLKAELGLITQKAAASVVTRVTANTDSAEALSRSALVVEAVTENKDVKAAVYSQILRFSGPDIVVWSNTSTLNVFDLAPTALTQRMLIAHWFAPPHILPLVELVAGSDTPSRIVDESIAILRMMGKSPVLLKKFLPGFVINRLLRALGREAFDMIEAGIISVEDIDVAVRSSLAPRMQVLGLMQRYDYTGLHLSMANLRNADFIDAPVNLEPKLLKERVNQGELGVTTGKGFYEYGGRSSVALQRERDTRLWKVAEGLGDLMFDPKPI